RPVLIPADRSIHDLAEKKEVLPLFKFLLGNKVIADRDTVSGRWSRRMSHVQEKSFPVLDQSRFLSFSGNLFNRLLIKADREEYLNLKRFHGKVLTAMVFHSESDFIAVLLNRKQELMRNLELWRKKRKLPESQPVFFILNEGRRSKGMPEMYYASEYLNQEKDLAGKSLLVTDGRFSGATYGLAFGYMEPEYADSGKLQQLKTGDLIRFDLYRRKFIRVNQGKTEKTSSDP
ncbi:MAG: dihydroxy-acid dehydratase, partial [bacterium]|nr:dihydroxy-acid dehydratase [bacterium]